MNWTEIVRVGAAAGLSPREIWETELWEYNAYVLARERCEKIDVANAVLTGYYAAYYTNVGKKAEKPEKIIEKLFAEKQSLKDGLADIARFKAAEERRSNGNQYNKSIADGK